MDDIKIWTISLCTTIVVSSIIMVIAPKNSLNRLLKTAVSAFFLSTVLSPMVFKDGFLLNFDSDAIVLSPDRSYFENQYFEIYSKTIEATVNNLVADSLDKISVKHQKILIDYSKDADQRISIIMVNIVISKEFQLHQLLIESTLNSDLGLPVKLIFV